MKRSCRGWSRRSIIGPHKIGRPPSLLRVCAQLRRGYITAGSSDISGETQIDGGGCTHMAGQPRSLFRLGVVKLIEIARKCAAGLAIGPSSPSASAMAGSSQGISAAAPCPTHDPFQLLEGPVKASHEPMWRRIGAMAMVTLSV